MHQREALTVHMVFNKGEVKNGIFPPQPPLPPSVHTLVATYPISSVDVGAEGEDEEDFLEIATLGGCNELFGRLGLGGAEKRRKKREGSAEQVGGGALWRSGIQKGQERAGLPLLQGRQSWPPVQRVESGKVCGCSVRRGARGERRGVG